MLRHLRRLSWLVVHLAFTAASLAWLALARRGATLVFTHAPDLDAEGRDAQMGPLVDGLLARGLPVVEWTLVPLDRSFLRNLRAKRRPFVSHAAVLGPARVLAAFAWRDRREVRVALARAVLRALRPRACYLVDESGSGQTVLRAARRLGIPTIGVQHGDFQPGNRQYALTAAASGQVEAADVLALWSPWFQRRLLAISPIYGESNTRVTGRLRYGRAAQEPLARGPRGTSEVVDVLVVSESPDSYPSFAGAAAPFLDALRADAGVRLRIRPHPAEDARRWEGAGELSRGPLARDLERAGVVVGVASSALLEALFHGRPAVSLSLPGLEDRAGYVAEGLLVSCGEPSALPGLCRALAAAGAPVHSRERVWGGAPEDAVEELLALGGLADPGEGEDAP